LQEKRQDIMVEQCKCVFDRKVRRKCIKKVGCAVWKLHSLMQLNGRDFPFTLSFELSLHLYI
jgi:hypothetical protein